MTACLRCVFRGDTFGFCVCGRGDYRSRYEGTLPVSHWMVKVVMWSPAAGLHHCNDLVNTKGACSPTPATQRHTEQSLLCC